MSNTPTTLSVVVVTLNRVDCLQICLERLLRETPEQVVVVDGSTDTATRDLVAEGFPSVEYVRNESGYGHMSRSRNLGLARCRGEVVAFIDDDAYVHPGWREGLLAAYADDPRIGGVGGRALNGQPGEVTEGRDRIGRLTAWGTIEGNFAADPGRTIEVDHLIGCNMSWRRSVLTELGGLRELYPGTEVREESDIALRVSALGYRLRMTPAAVVDHVGAPQSKGRRFDERYVYYAARNHAVLLWMHGGPASGRFWRWGLAHVARSGREVVRSAGGAVLRFGAAGAGLMVGLLAGMWHRVRLGRDPRRGGGLEPVARGAESPVASESGSSPRAVEVGP